MIDTIIIILTILSVATFLILCLIAAHYLNEPFAKKTKNSAEELANMSRQAKADAQEKLEKAVTKEIVALQKTLQAQANSLQAGFTKNLQDITTTQLVEFKKTMDLADSNMKDQAKMVAHQGQQHTEQLQKNLADEVAQIKKKVLDSTDEQIAEIMISYLAEVAGDLDYQQQKEYLYNSIEANKDAIKKDIANAV